MKVVGISDLHGYLPENIIPECVILCIAGDVLPLDIQSNSSKSRKWLHHEFLSWCKRQPAAHVVLVAGNHDFYFEDHDYDVHKMCDDAGFDIHYLNNENITIEGVNIFGSPDCHIFFDWAFMYDNAVEKEHFLNMWRGCDIMVTHDAPYGTSDICMADTPWNTHEHIGNPALKDAILEREPRYCLHGHLHTTNHECEMLGKTAVYNVSYIDEAYKPAFEPLVLDIDLVDHHVKI